MTNPYRPSTETTLVAPLRASRIRLSLAAITMLCGLYVAASGINRFIFCGGFELLAAMSVSERESAALWAATHIAGMSAAFTVCVGFLRNSRRMVLLGTVGFVVVCMYSWVRPMDFLWFAGTR